MRIYWWSIVVVLSLLQIGNSQAQQALGVHPLPSLQDIALQAFLQDRPGEACPFFREWREQFREREGIHATAAQQAVIFRSLLCGLRQAEPQAAQETLQFLASAPERSLQDRLRAALADYYFRTRQWAACVEQYAQAGIIQFSNREIATAQFQQGYAHFILQQFNEARTFFNSVRSLPEGLYKSDATYYYALLLIKERNWDEALLSLRLLQSDSTYGPYVPYLIAQLLVSKEKQDEAISYVLARQQQLPAPYYQKELEQLLGQAYFSKKQYDEALVHLNIYAEGTPMLSRDDLYRIAYCAYYNEQWSLATPRLLQLSAQQDSLGQHALFLLGNVYLKQSNYTAARSAFLFVSLNSGHSQEREAARFLHAKLSYQLGFFDEALTGLKSFMSTYPMSSYLSEAKELQLAVLAATSNYKEALELLTQLMGPSETARRLFAPVLYGRAAELINDGEWQSADHLLDRALIDPFNQSLLPYLFFWKGELAFRSGRYQEAVDYFQGYLQKGAPTLGEVRPPHARYSLAYSFLRLGLYEQALPLFASLSGKAAANDGALVQDALVRQADCLLMLKKYGSATALYQQVIDFAWKEADYSLYQLATIAGIKKPDEKIRLLRLFEASYPGSPLLTASWMAIADTYMEDERFAMAIPFLEKIVAKEKSAQLLPQTYFKLGIAHYNSDNNEKAKEQFKYILDHFANSEEAGDALDNLKAIYLEEGRAADFISLARSKGISLTISATDSLRFSAAEKLFADKQFDQAAMALEGYLSEIDRPSFALEAYAMLAAMAQQNKLLDKALQYYDSMLALAPNRFVEEAALQAARISYFEQKNYERAIGYYTKLFELTALASSKLEALRGLLRAHYQLGQLELAAGRGALLLNEKGVSADDKALVALVAAKNYSQQGKEEEAQFSLRQVISLNKGALAAEARYEQAASFFRKQQYKLAEKAAFETINKSGSYEEWVTRAYLLLGDIYFVQADYFNAKATYQSVKDNAGTEVFRKVAAEKLAMALQAEADKTATPKK